MPLTDEVLTGGLQQHNNTLKKRDSFFLIQYNIHNNKQNCSIIYSELQTILKYFCIFINH